MLDKLKSITNKVSVKAAELQEKLKVREKVLKIKDLSLKTCHAGRRQIDRLGRKTARSGISANTVTITGFVIGIFAINFLSLEMYGYALLCILLNRFFDALDGAIARNSGITDFGVFLDATLDYIFYAGVIFGFALANPGQNAIAACFLLFAFTTAACAMLAYAVVAYKNNSGQKLELNQSPFYLGGLAQGSETFVALIVLCLIPSWFLQIAIILGVLSMVKALSVIAAAYYNFVIALRNKKNNPDA